MDCVYVSFSFWFLDCLFLTLLLALLTITGRLSKGKILFLLSLGRFSAMAISPGCGPFVRDFGNRGGEVQLILHVDYVIHLSFSF